MKVDALRDAMEKAETFLRLAIQVPVTSLQVGKMLDGKIVTNEFIETGKASAACKRASMDLTRALTGLRKP